MQPKSSRWKFVADRRRPVYPTLASELDAVRRGKKAISFFATDRDGLAEDLAAIQPAVNQRGLRVTIAPRGKATRANQDVDLFVHRDYQRPDQGAQQRTLIEDRIRALQALLSSSPWTFEHEATLGELLGYSPAQRRAWLAAEHHARPAFGVLTLYASIVTGYPAPLAWWTEPGRVPAPDAYKDMKKRVDGLQLWRVGVDPSFEKHLDDDEHVMLASARKKQKAFDKAVRTPLELLGPKGWHVPSKRR